MKNSLIKKFSLPVSVITIFVWIGFVSSISFMEAWLKFRAPHVTLPVGLGIGKLIFAALNRMEWVFAVLLTACIFLSEKKLKFSKWVFFYLPIAILFVQTFFLLPLLNERADAISKGMVLSKSLVHFYYLFLEITKVSSLFLLGINRFIGSSTFYTAEGNS